MQTAGQNVAEFQGQASLDDNSIYMDNVFLIIYESNSQDLPPTKRFSWTPLTTSTFLPKMMQM